MNLYRIILIILLIVVNFGCSNSEHEKGSNESDVIHIAPELNIRWVTNITGVKFPDDISDIETYDNGEFYLILFMKLPEKSISNFTQKYNFKKITQVESSQDILLFGLDKIREPNNILPPKKNLVYYQNRSESNTWIFVLEKETRRLWCEVHYPDPGGTPP